LGDDDIMYEENRKSNDKRIVKSLVKLFDTANIVIAHNGERFDGPKIMGRALTHGITPPAPYKWIDTLRVARKEFSFTHNSLESLARLLKCTPKKKHGKFPGFELWLECLRGNEAAWNEMAEYNIQDVETLEEVYLKMRPWTKHGPNMGVFMESDKPVCSKCGSDDLVKNGHDYLKTGKYQMYKCKSCGGFSRARFTEYPKEERKVLLTGAS